MLWAAKSCMSGTRASHGLLDCDGWDAGRAVKLWFFLSMF